MKENNSTNIVQTIVVVLVIAAAVPGLIILAPALKVMFEFSPMVMIGIDILFFALLLGLPTPQLDLVTRIRRWWLPSGAPLPAWDS